MKFWIEQSTKKSTKHEYQKGTNIDNKSMQSRPRAPKGGPGRPPEPPQKTKIINMIKKT